MRKNLYVRNSIFIIQFLGLLMLDRHVYDNLNVAWLNYQQKMYINIYMLQNKDYIINVVNNNNKNIKFKDIK
jgi:hypothetical protein